MADDPMTKFAHSLGEYKTVSEVATLIGKSVSTIRRWSRNGLCKAPSKTVQQGGLTIHLYTPEDIEELRALAAVQVAGRRYQGGPSADGTAPDGSGADRR